jgi:hypothetical protein
MSWPGIKAMPGELPARGKPAIAMLSGFSLQGYLTGIVSRIPDTTKAQDIETLAEGFYF